MDVVTNDIYWILSFDMDQAKRAHLSIYPQILCSHVFIWIQRIKVMWPMRIFTYSSVWPRGRQLRLWLYDWSDISNPASFAEAGRRSRGLKKMRCVQFGIWRRTSAEPRKKSFWQHQIRGFPTVRSFSAQDLNWTLKEKKDWSFGHHHSLRPFQMFFTRV